MPWKALGQVMRRHPGEASPPAPLKSGKVKEQEIGMLIVEQCFLKNHGLYIYSYVIIYIYIYTYIYII